MNIELEVEDIVIERQEACFDRACDEAYRRAIDLFGIDEDGHSTRLRLWETFNSWLEVALVMYTRVGSSHVYNFKARAMKNQEEDNG